jgi:hypothetical protein
MYQNNTNNFFYPFMPALACVENWTANFYVSPCYANYTQYIQKTYVDQNSCNTTTSLPGDNGSITANTCGQSLTWQQYSPLNNSAFYANTTSFAYNWSGKLTHCTLYRNNTQVASAFGVPAGKHNLTYNTTAGNWHSYINCDAINSSTKYYTVLSIPVPPTPPKPQPDFAPGLLVFVITLLVPLLIIGYIIPEQYLPSGIAYAVMVSVIIIIAVVVGLALINLVL